MDHLNPQSPHWSAPEKINLGGFVQNACNALDNSQTYIVCKIIGTIAMGCMGKPVARVIDILAQGVFGTIKIGTGAIVMPVVYVWDFCWGKKDVSYNWTLSQGIHHYAMGFFCLLDIPLSILNLKPDLYLKVIRTIANVQAIINEINAINISNDLEKQKLNEKCTKCEKLIGDLYSEINKFIELSENKNILINDLQNKLKKANINIDVNNVNLNINEVQELMSHRIIMNLKEKICLLEREFKELEYQNEEEINKLKVLIKDHEETIDLRNMQINKLQETKKNANKVHFSSQNSNQSENIINKSDVSTIESLKKEIDELQKKLKNSQETSINVKKESARIHNLNQDLTNLNKELTKKIEIYESIRNSISSNMQENENLAENEKRNIVLDSNLLAELLSSLDEKNESEDLTGSDNSNIENDNSEFSNEAESSDNEELSDTEENRELKDLLKSSQYGRDNYKKIVEIKNKERKINIFENELKEAVQKINLKRVPENNNVKKQTSSILNNSKEISKSKQSEIYNNAEKNVILLFNDAGLEDWIDDMKEEYIVKDPESGSKININWWSLLIKTMVSYDKITDYDKRTTQGIHREFFDIKIQAKEGLKNPIINSNTIRKFKENADQCLNFNFKDPMFMSLYLRNQSAETPEDKQINSAAKFLQILRTMKYVRSKTRKEKKFLENATQEILKECETQKTIEDDHRKTKFFSTIEDISEIINLINLPNIKLNGFETTDNPRFESFKKNFIELKSKVIVELNKIELLSNSQLTRVSRSKDFNIELCAKEIFELINDLKISYEKLTVSQKVELEYLEKPFNLNGLLKFAEGCFRAFEYVLIQKENIKLFDDNSKIIQEKMKKRNVVFGEQKKIEANISSNEYVWLTVENTVKDNTVKDDPTTRDPKVLGKDLFKQNKVISDPKTGKINLNNKKFNALNELLNNRNTKIEDSNNQ